MKLNFQNPVLQNMWGCGKIEKIGLIQDDKMLYWAYIELV